MEFVRTTSHSEDDQADAIMLRRILGEFIMPTQRTRAMIELEERGLMKYQPRHLKFFPTEAGRALLDSACGRAKS